MSPPPPFSAGDGGGDGGGEEAKAAGFVVFSGIAMSIVKALAFKPPQRHSPPSPSPSPYPSPSPSPQEKLATEEEPRIEAPKSRVVDIARGDTLWGLSRRYGCVHQEHRIRRSMRISHNNRVLGWKAYQHFMAAMT